MKTTRNILLAALLLGAIVAGCQSPENVGLWQTRLNEGQQWRSQQEERIERLTAEAESLPEGSPERAAKVAELAKAHEDLAKLNAYVQNSQRHLEDELKRPVGDPTKVVVPIPPGTGWGELITAGVAGALALYAGIERYRSVKRKEENEKLRSDAEQIVNANDAASPIRTDEQRLIMAAKLDEGARELIAKARAKRSAIPPEPVPVAVPVPVVGEHQG